MQGNNSFLDENQKLLIEAYRLQNDQAYDETLQKLQIAGENLIQIIEKIQSSSEFYLRNMQLMKEERDLVSEKDYKEFLAKNQKIISSNYEKNAYLALLMQEMEEKEEQVAVGSSGGKKWSAKDEDALRRLVEVQGLGWQEIAQRFPRVRQQELRRRFEQAVGRIRREQSGSAMEME